MSDERWNAILPVPFVNRIAGICLGVVNCFFPGLGLAIASCCQKGKFNSYILVIALCQFLLAFIVIGWIWAIVNGIYMIILVCSPQYEAKKAEFEQKCNDEQRKDVEVGNEVVNAN
ncbi:Transmembrane domain-containing protein [Spironucleus salmonicida]|uniref:Transmembrane domain-containing protein n=1 Tax=Spironucleus salmonicida TaxID=348837 RepID=V6LUZ3_9EUKA|nr:Transmembrane domain-containing protein [Spironucleus salmonicida]|eukprot:EST44624.1 Transmembrane domain-containing protein [Spironucleus salmonicida]